MDGLTENLIGGVNFEEPRAPAIVCGELRDSRQVVGDKNVGQTELAL
jgi:hypothetical protein